MSRKLFLAGLAALLSLTATAATDNTTVASKDGKLNYKVDGRGNRVLDFSYCGYYDSSRPIPEVRNVIYVPFAEGDNSARIQRAIDYVSSLPAGKDGFRGAVLLGKGDFRIDSPLRISASGVVLRGSGVHETTLTKHGFNRGSLLYVEGTDNPVTGDTIAVAEAYVPVNSRKLTLGPKGASLKPGQNVFIVRPSTNEWIESMGCEIFGGGISALGWKAGDVDLRWDREVVADSAGTVTLDAPLAMALDEKYGKAYVLPYTWPGRISNVGVENLTLVSDYNKKYPKDEDHCWNGISVSSAENCFVRKVDFRHFAGSAVILQPTSSRVTVEDCRATEPVSETGGMRRRVFLTLGQLNLFQRCYSRQGIHDFAAGMYAAGPNAFVQCDSEESLGFSGAIDAWAPGLLYDVVNIDGNNITFRNLGQDKNGAGWNTGNSLMWQCTASELECFTPAPDAVNQVYGSWGQFSGDGLWAQSNNHVQPRSFFYAQLAERLDSVPERQSRILPRATNATSSPTVEAAMKLAHEAATQPRLTLQQWIEEAPAVAAVDPAGLKSIDAVRMKENKKAASRTHDYALADGLLLIDGAVMTGGRHEVPWWNGKIKPNYTAKAKPAITRFVPGQEGNGLTDRVDSVISWMNDNDIAVLDHNYGLWYERRRDDHERIRRQNGDVWAPFYEQPFARSGEGTAWDGLSRYDLTRPNEYYWSRLQDFADKGAAQGKVLFNEMYFQHNIIEAGAHWVDSPWRTVNNINNTGFPEPVPFAGDKRVFMAEPFYDVNDPVRRELHRNFIRMNLDKLADRPNVVHLVSAEYTGPQHFMEFWLDVIDEWQREKGKDVKVALSATKDVQDAILANPKYRDLVDIIDIRYWHYKTDGIYAPEGGKNLAPRQHARKMKVGKVTFPEAYRAVSEYRTQYPEKAVTYYAQNYPDMAWAVFMGGGSLAGIPVKDAALLRAAAGMKPVVTADDEGYKALSGNDGMIVFAQKSGDLGLALPAGKYAVKAYDAKSGAATGTQTLRSAGVKGSESSASTLVLPAKSGQVYLITRK